MNTNYPISGDKLWYLVIVYVHVGYDMFVIVLTTYDGRCYFVCYCAYHSGVASIHDGSCVLLITLNVFIMGTMTTMYWVIKYV